MAVHGAWYQQEAQQFKANALVFLETPNEPSGSARNKLRKTETGIIKAIRATGFATQSACTACGGFDQSNIPAVTAAVGTGDVVTPHISTAAPTPMALPITCRARSARLSPMDCSSH